MNLFWPFLFWIFFFALTLFLPAFFLRKKKRILSIVLFSLFGIFAAFEFHVYFSEVSGRSLRKDYEEIARRFLEDDTELKAEIFGDEKRNSFGVTTLSFYAQGLSRYAELHPEKADEIRQILEIAAKWATSKENSPYDEDLCSETELAWENSEGDTGFYLAHAAFVLSALVKLDFESEYKTTLSSVADYLAMRTLEEATAHVPSVPSGPLRFPADQCAALSSVYSYDEIFGGDLSALPISNWLAYMKAFATTEKGLHLSEITGNVDYAEIPRGCGLSWEVYFLSDWAPEVADELWKSYKKEMGRGMLPFYAFREYPKGYSRGSDNDSGPILFGLGSSATAFGVGAAKSMEDGFCYFRLRSFEEFARGFSRVLKLFGVSNLSALSDSNLALSVSFAMKSSG